MRAALHHISPPTSGTARRAPHATLAAALIVGALISGCTALSPSSPGKPVATPSTPATPSGPTTPEGKPRNVQVCNAQPVQSLVGKPNTAQTLESARKQSGSYMARVLGVNQPTTREYDQERLNLIVDNAGKIIAVRCG